MESHSLTSVPTASSPKSPQKRTSSPSAPVPHSKKPKTEGYPDKDKRKRKKKEQPVACDSGIMSGLTQIVRSPSLSPKPPLPSASSSIEKQLSLVPSQSDSLLSSSVPPPLVCSPLAAIASSSNGQLAPHTPLLKEGVIYSESKSLLDHKALLASLVSSLVCQICLDLLHEPFALPPCGHVSCYGCLVNWFNVDQQPDGLDGGRAYRKKTCPQCRAVVRGRPIEAWNVKDMVIAVVKSGLTQDFPSPVEVNSKGAAPTSNSEALRDPWANIFPPILPRPETEGSPGAFGMYDAEDQVHRCLDCMHEIWGGSCSQCGRHYSGHNVDASDDDAPGDELWGFLPVMEHIIGFPRGDIVDESDDGSYEASFIDDEGSECHDNEAVEISSDDNVDSIVGVATRQGVDGAGEVQITSSEDDQVGDEKFGDVDDNESQTTRRHPALGTRRQVLSDSDGDDNYEHSAKSEDDDGSLSRPPMRLFGRHPTVPVEESVDSRSTESDDSDNISSDEGRACGLQWSGGECGMFTEDEDDAW